MRTARWAIAAALALVTLSGCFLIFDYDPAPRVDLTASSTWIETGERSILAADAYDPEGQALSYEWYENGVPIAGETDSILAYWTAVEETEYVTISVVVRDGHGGYGTDSVDITVDPIYDPVILVINNSSYTVQYFRDSRSPYNEWSYDRTGADYIPPGESYLIFNHDFWGYVWDTWNLRAIAAGQDYESPGWYWQQDGVYLTPNDVYEFVLTD